ncbi:MAG: hypothetical protein J6K42_03215 [Clostridia bacterium]|nr:hypothetical protein [Clostridia bacterium]
MLILNISTFIKKISLEKVGKIFGDGDFRGRRFLGTENFGDGDFWGRRISGTEIFGDGEFWGRRILGTENFGDGENFLRPRFSPSPFFFYFKLL